MINTKIYILRFINILFLFLFNLTKSEYCLKRINPVFVSWFITWDCQKNCSYCNARKQIKNDNLMNLHEIENTAKDLYNLGNIAITITGGEPLTCKYLLSVLKIFKKYNFIININTNGLLLPKYWNCFKHFVHSYTIGIDALNNAEKKKTTKYLKSIINHNYRPRIYIRRVLTKNNIQDAAEKHKFYLNYSDRILYQILHKKMTITDYNNGKVKAIPEKTEVNNLNKIIHSNLLKKYINFIETKNKCICGKYNLTISPYGDIYNCNHFKYKFGNIRDNNFSIKNLIKYKKNILKKCHSLCFTNDRRLEFNIL